MDQGYIIGVYRESTGQENLLMGFLKLVVFSVLTLGP